MLVDLIDNRKRNKARSINIDMVRSFVKFSASHSKSARDRRSGRDGRLDRDERPTYILPDKRKFPSLELEISQ